MANNQNPNIPNQSSPDYHNETKQENLNSSNTSNSPSPDELLKELKEKGSAGVLNFYIDSRSGGAYFSDKVDIVGDVVGGDQIKGATNLWTPRYRRELAGQIRNLEIKKLQSVYLETINYEKVKQILNDHHILLLYGNAHHGKRATAIYLTISLLQSEEVFEIDPTIENLGLFKSEKKHGYIIDNITFEGIRKLNQAQTNNLSQHLKTQESYLVITIDNLTSSAKQSLEDYIFEWSCLNHRSESDNVLEKHLIWYLRTSQFSRDNYSEILQNQSVCELLDKGLLPGQIDKLAGLLSKVVKGNLNLEESVAHFCSIASQQVEIWFDEHQTIEERTDMISLAVLSGTNYEYFREASNNLRLNLQSLEKPTDKEPVNRPDNKRSKFLEEFGAKIEYGYENKHYGEIKVELIELKNQEFQRSVLSYIWQEYDQWREPILKWLNNLGLHSNMGVKFRTAAALGQLSIYAFGHVIDQVLQPWAKSSNQEQQRLAALALSIPLSEDELAPQVLKLIRHWSTLKNSPKLQMTAIIAYGGYIGTRFPEAAFRDLLTIAESEEPAIASAVVESMVSLFFFGQLYLPVLTTLQKWTQKNKTTFTPTLSLFTFTLIMGEVEVPDTEPILFWLIWEEQELAKNQPESGKECENIVIYLLRQALNLKLTRRLALEGLYKSLNFADYDHRLYPVLGQILYKMVAEGTEREKERIIYYLNQWANNRPCAASKIRSKIKNHLGI